MSEPSARPTAGGPVSERLQALLNRAVEDQIDGQRQLSGVLDDLVRQVEALSGAVQAAASGAAVDRLGGELGAHRDELRQSAATLAQLHEQVTLAGSAVSGLDQRVAGQQEDTARTASGVAELSREVAAVAVTVGGLAERVSAVRVPSAQDIANAVAPMVADGLAERLAPRIAELVLQAAGHDLVGATSEQVLVGVRAEQAGSERRILAHVDETVFALAEALLRRSPGPRDRSADSSAAVADQPANGPGALGALGALPSPESAPAPESDAAPVEAAAGTPPTDDVPVDQPPVGHEAVDGPAADGPAADGPAVDGPAVDDPAVDGPAVDDVAAGTSPAPGNVFDDEAPLVETLTIPADLHDGEEPARFEVHSGAAVATPTDQHVPAMSPIALRAAAARAALATSTGPLVEPTPDLEPDDGPSLLGEPAVGEPTVSGGLAASDPSRTPPIESADQTRAVGDDEDEGQARKPWWRPGG